MPRLELLPWLRRALLLGIEAFVILAAAACTGQVRPLDSSGAYEGTALDGPAADFRLVDQNGAQVALSDVQGRVVVLTFLDSQCQEMCPLTAVHLRSASRALAAEAGSVIFLGINVNENANDVAEVASATREWMLDEIPTWHFLTGDAEQLKSVWEAYHILVIPATADEELVHTPGVYLIDQAGQKRWYVSTPFDDAGTPQWTAPLRELLEKHIRELLIE